MRGPSTDSRRLHLSWFAAGLLSVLALRLDRPLAKFLKGLHDRQGVTVAEQCAAPECTNTATTGPLCYVCEGKWMRERSRVVEGAEHLTDLAAQFQKYCAEHNQPNPYD